MRKEKHFFYSSIFSKQNKTSFIQDPYCYLSDGGSLLEIALQNSEAVAFSCRTNILAKFDGLPERNILEALPLTF